MATKQNQPSFISFSDLSVFEYHYNNSNNKPSVHYDNNENYKINIVNGVCKNYEDDNIEIRNITNLDSKKFADQNDKNIDDLVIDFNKIFLNSGIFIDIKENSKISLQLIHSTEKNQTIFQNNFINFQKNCKVNLENEFNFSYNTINNRNYDGILTSFLKPSYQ